MICKGTQTIEASCILDHVMVSLRAHNSLSRRGTDTWGARTPGISEPISRNDGGYVLNLELFDYFLLEQTHGVFAETLVRYVHRNLVINDSLLHSVQIWEFFVYSVD